MYGIHRQLDGFLRKIYKIEYFFQPLHYQILHEKEVLINFNCSMHQGWIQFNGIIRNDLLSQLFVVKLDNHMPNGQYPVEDQKRLFSVIIFGWKKSPSDRFSYKNNKKQFPTNNFREKKDIIYLSTIEQSICILKLSSLHLRMLCAKFG